MARGEDQSDLGGLDSSDMNRVENETSREDRSSQIGLES